MGITNRVKESWQALRGATDEAHVPSDPDSHLWQPLASRGKTNNLPKLSQQQSTEFAHYFYKSNPIAKRIIDLTAEYVVGDGIKYVAEDPKVQEILDAHWADGTNNWSINQFTRVRDLGLTGELCIPAYVNPNNGHVTLGNIDTSLIDDIIEDPENNMKQHLVV